MGKLLKKFEEMRAKNKAPAAGTGGAGPKAPHTADWLLQKHRADQGLAEQPTDPNATPASPVTGGGTAPATGGIVEDEMERKRRLATGIQL